MAKLTSKQRWFVDAYCSNGFNATRAAIEAGYSEKTARQLGSQLLSNINIQDAVQDFMAKASEMALVTTEDVVRGLKDEATNFEEGTSQSARVSAWKALSDYTGGFDANKRVIEATVTTTKSFNDMYGDTES